jgi:flavodoxin
MNALIVYDSQYGNTREVALAIAESIPEARALRPDEAGLADRETLDILVVGSPTQGGRPTPAIKQFLDAIPPGGLANVGVAAFDTRIKAEGRGILLKAITGILGYAAGRIESNLGAKGARVIAKAEGFGVVEKEGPLEPGELDRARSWGSSLAAASSATNR